jgi:MFS family permease
MVISVFGGMLLLPLYLQVVRGETPMDTGLLLAPQGVGAMIAMPISGKLTDRTGIGRIVPVGLAIVGASFIGLTQLGADTSYWFFGGVLFVMGVGMGTTMMPTFSGAMQTLRRASIARASTTLNIVQQAGASIGTAVMAVLLANAVSARLSGSASAVGTIDPAARKKVAPLMADAYGATYWWAFALVAVAFFVALFLLPKHKPAPVEDDADAAADVSVVHPV